MALLDNLTGYYKFYETVGSTTAKDWTGNRAAASTNGTAPFFAANGKVLGNNCATFNGTDDYFIIQSGYVLATQTSATVAGWINVVGTPSSGYAIYSERAATGNDIWKLEINSSGSLQFTHRNDASTLDTINTGANHVNDANWHFIVFTKSGTAINLYIDNQNKGSGSLSGNDTLTDASPSCRFGTDIQDGTSWYKGLLQDMGLWSGRTVSTQEMTTLWNNGNGLTLPFTSPRFPNSGLRPRPFSPGIAR